MTVPGGAGFCPERRYRYVLWREVNPDGEGFLLWVMANPSKADEERPDATVRRVVDFTRRWGYRYLVIVNLCAAVSTDPKTLDDMEDPEGPDNDLAIRWAASFARMVVCAWGANGDPSRARHVVDLLLADHEEVWAFQGETKSGQPLHPLRLAKVHALRIFKSR